MAGGPGQMFGLGGLVGGMVGQSLEDNRTAGSLEQLEQQMRQMIGVSDPMQGSIGLASMQGSSAATDTELYEMDKEDLLWIPPPEPEPAPKRRWWQRGERKRNSDSGRRGR